MVANENISRYILKWKNREIKPVPKSIWYFITGLIGFDIGIYVTHFIIEVMK